MIDIERHVAGLTGKCFFFVIAASLSARFARAAVASPRNSPRTALTSAIAVGLNVQVVGKAHAFGRLTGAPRCCREASVRFPASAILPK